MLVYIYIYIYIYLLFSYLFFCFRVVKTKDVYMYLLKTGLGILDFYHSDWLNGARLSAHIPAVTKYGQ